MTEAPTSSAAWRTIVAGVVGNVLEWFDFALFGYFAVVIGRLFFPSEDPVASLLQSFGVFALGYCMRPIGGMLFGRFGDRAGRKRALQYSVMLMALPTTMVGLLPTYSQIGLWAPILLTLIRILQGISVGGELIGSYSFLGEHAQDRHRGLWCSLSTSSSGFGLLMGSAVAAFLTEVLPPEDLDSWGWRLPFLSGLLVGLVGLWLRGGVDESHCFKSAAAGGIPESPLLDAIRLNGASVLRTAALAIPLSVGFYLPFVWLPTWLTDIRKPGVLDALDANTCAMFATISLAPLAGWLSDRLGRRQVFGMGALGMLVVAYPAFCAFNHGGFQQVLAGQLAMAICSAMMCGPAPAMFVELFPTRTRYSGIAIGYNGVQAVLGGTTPLVATWLVQGTGSIFTAMAYLVAFTIVALCVAIQMRDATGQPLT